MANVSECTSAFSSHQVAVRLYANVPVSVLGLLANALNAAVFGRAAMRQSLVNWFLLALTCSDLLLLLCNLLFLGLPVIADRSHSLFFSVASILIVKYAYPVGMAAQTASVYLTVLVSAHRYLGVCQPFRAQRYATAGAVKLAIAFAFAFSAALNACRLFELRIGQCDSAEFGRRVPAIELTALSQHPVYFGVYRVVTYTLVMFVAPFAILIVVNSLMVAALRRSRTLRRTTTRRSTLDNAGAATDHSPPATPLASYRRFKLKLKRSGSTTASRDRSVTVMLIAIVVLFLCCNTLPFINNFAEIAIAVSYKRSGHVSERVMRAFDILVEVGNVLVALNSSATILIYLAFSTKYREQLWRPGAPSSGARPAEPARSLRAPSRRLDDSVPSASDGAAAAARPLLALSRATGCH